MTIDISALTHKKVVKQDIYLELNSEELFVQNSEITVNKPVLVKGTVSMIEDILYLDVEITGELMLVCSRCAEDFAYALDITFHEEFSNIRDSKDDSIIFIDSDNIDITDIIENNIILALPIKSLCSESCKGLCQKCGTNLNISTCNCQDGDIDPRLARLKDLFGTD